jgi:ligand-binding sensor domain-containing protein/AraC-like DNA-binding protein
MGLIKFLVLATAIYLPFYSYSLDPSKKLHHYVHRSWQSVDGLPQNSAHSIAQSENGFIWIATQEGLVRFDGVSFRVYNRTNHPELGSNDIRTLALGKDGTLWVGTYGGGAIKFTKDEMKSFNTDNGLSGNLVRAIYIDDDNCAWIGTFNHGLNKVCNGEINIYSTEDGLPDNNIRSITGYGKTVYIGTTKGLVFFEDGKATKIFTDHNGLENSNVSTVYINSSGILFVGTKNGYLHTFENDKFKSYLIPGSVEADFINEIYEDRHGSLWIGTEKGLHRFKDGSFESFSAKDGLTYEAVRSIMEDKEGSLWVGTSGGGINLFSDGKILTLSTDDGLSSGDILPVMYDSYGNLWAGTALKGLDMIAPDMTVVNYDIRNGLADNRVLSLYECNDGNIWVGTVSGMSVMNNDGVIRQIFQNEEKLSKPVSTILQSNTGQIFAGTHGEGIFVIENFKTIRNISQKQGLKDGIVLSKTIDSKGTLWIGTMNGLYVSDGTNAKEYPESTKLSGKAVYSLYFDDKERLWIGTDSGLNLIEDGEIYRINDPAFLLTDSVYAITKHNEKLFLSSNLGIFTAFADDLRNAAFTGKPLSSNTRRYDFSDGMKSMECNGGFSPSVTRSPDGKILFPTINGIAVLDPELERVNNIVPEVIIESLISENNKYFDTFNHRNVFVFDPGTERFEFHYTATSFVAPPKVRFKYMLEGFDKDFIDAGNRRAAYYTNLKPGEYKFKVIASNNEDLWNLDGDEIRFVIKPLFFQTTAFAVFLYVIILILTALPLTAYFYKKMNKIKKINIALKKRAEEAEKKYEKSKLSEQVSTNYLEDLFELMDKEKLYRNPLLKIHDIAKKLSISHIYLSQIINLHTGMTFYTLLSLYRTSEVMEKLSLPENLDENIISLAYEAGFNTKSSFNSAFKKFTNLTPTEYRKKYSEKSKKPRNKINK